MSMIVLGFFSFDYNLDPLVILLTSLQMDGILFAQIIETYDRPCSSVVSRTHSYYQSKLNCCALIFKLKHQYFLWNNKNILVNILPITYSYLKSTIAQQYLKFRPPCFSQCGQRHPVSSVQEWMTTSEGLKLMTARTSLGKQHLPPGTPVW
jgi:hypothetical protein